MSNKHLLTHAKPFIIWTLQRTGGTNLTSRLVGLSGLASTQHEPFNLGRTYGEITQQWLQNGDQVALDTAMAGIVKSGAVIKHCLETVPWEVTESLARASTLAGYLHLFLYRRNATDRLLSLHFAQQTGVWGADMKSFKKITGASEANSGAAVEDISEDALAQALPVGKLVAHERRCVNLLTRLFALLCGCGAKPIALAYEDIYLAPDYEEQVQALISLLRGLGLSKTDAEDRAWVAGLLESGDQGTRDKYALFPGAGELSKALREVASFSPNVPGKPLVTQDWVAAQPWILRFFVDVLPAETLVGQDFEVGGVLVLSQDAPEGLHLRFGNSRVATSVDWGRPSPRVAKEHPHGKNSAVARWLGTGRFTENEQTLTLRLVAQDSTEFLIAEIALSVMSNVGANKE